MDLNISDAARRLWDHGLIPIPVNQNKYPLMTFRHYAERDMTEDELDRAFPAGTKNNLAILTRRIVVIDCDGEPAYQWALNNLPVPGWVCQTGRGYHLYYRCPQTDNGWLAYGPRNSSWHKSEDQERHIDIKTGMSYVLAPPSVHANGAVYQWLGTESPLTGAGIDAVTDLPVFEPESYNLAIRHISLSASAEAAEPQRIERQSDGTYAQVLDSGARAPVLPPARSLTDIERKNLQTLLEALERDPELRKNGNLSEPYTYDNWYRVILAVRNRYGDSDQARQLVTDWSRRDHAGWDDRESRRAIENIWHSPAAANPVTLKSFYSRAQKFGWTEDHGVTIDLSGWEAEDQATDDRPVYRLASFAALADSRPPEPEWVINNVAQRGEVTLLTAYGGVGKTVFLVDLAYHLQAGLNYGGIGVPRPARALVLLAETSDSALARYLTTADTVFQFRALAPASAIPRQEIEGGVLLMVRDPRTRILALNQVVLKRLERYVDQANADLLVIDTCYDIYAGDEIDRAEVTRLFNEALLPLARRSNMAIIMTMHRSKSGGTSGSTAWENKANVVLSLTVPAKYANTTTRSGKAIPREDLGRAFPIRELAITKSNDGPVGSLGRWGIWKDKTVPGPALVSEHDFEGLARGSLTEISDRILARETGSDYELIVEQSSEPWHTMVEDATRAEVSKAWTDHRGLYGPSVLVRALNRAPFQPWAPHIDTLRVGDLEAACGLTATEMWRPEIENQGQRTDLVRIKHPEHGTVICLRSMVTEIA